MRLFINFLMVAVLSIYTTSVFAQSAGGNLDFIVVSPESAAGSYEWGGTTDFGPSITENFCGELIWGGSVENLACDPITEDLSGKIALIRRGVCDFSLKIWHAQEAGAIAVVVVGHDQDPNGPDAIIGMLGGEMADEVTIPAIFISYTSGQIIVPAVNEGTVEVCFQLPTFEDPMGAYSYSTPQDHIIPLEGMRVTVTNRDAEDKTDVEVTLEITNPLGEVETLTDSKDLPVGDTVVYRFGSYLPKELGVYDLKYTSGNDGSVIETNFEITLEALKTVQPDSEIILR